jgi:hypothetical protein
MLNAFVKILGTTNGLLTSLTKIFPNYRSSLNYTDLRLVSSSVCIVAGACFLA